MTDVRTKSKHDATNNPHGLKVGQQLWFVSSLRGGLAHYVTVKKIGRKWADIGQRDRISLETLVADGGNFMSPGSCYLSKEEHEQMIARSVRWARIQRFARDQYGRPDFIDEAALSILEGVLRLASLGQPS